MSSVYRKVNVNERLPEKGGSYGVIVGDDFFSQADFYYSCFTDSDEWSRNNITHWLEEIELPTEEDIYTESKVSKKCFLAFEKGANFIKNHIEKGGKG